VKAYSKQVWLESVSEPM